MTRRLACVAFALLLPQVVSAADSKPPAVAECEGEEASAAKAAVHFDGKGKDLLAELIRVKRIEVDRPELIGDKSMKFEFSCVPVAAVMSMLADESQVQFVHEGEGRYRLAKARNYKEILELRAEVSAARGTDRPKQIQTLERIVALSQPGGPGEPPASVEDEYHELGNLAMEDKDYVAAERWYRARVAHLDLLKVLQDTDYGIAVSNIADALAFQDDHAAATPLYERALAVLGKQTDLHAPPNAVIILETLSNGALAAKRYDEAEALAERAWVLLSDPKRSQWESAEHALELAADAEAELGRLGLEPRAELHYTRALTVLEARYAADSEEYIERAQRMMFGAAAAGRLDAAIRIARNLFVAADRRGQRTSDAYVVALYQLLALHARQGELDDVIALWPRLIEARRALLGDDSPHVVEALRQLATLYRVNAQWDQAAAPEQRAAAIKPVDDSAALAKLESITGFAMQFDPALSVFCAPLAQPFDLSGLRVESPAPPIHPIAVFFEPITEPAPVPTDKTAQARHFEQTAECFSESTIYAAAAMERALGLRIAVHGAKSPEARRAAERAAELYRRAGFDREAERLRAMVGG